MRKNLIWKISPHLSHTCQLDKDTRILDCSFRDPAGFIFRKDGVLYRQINRNYVPDYNLLKESGLYDDLVQNGLLIPHEEVHIDPISNDGQFVIKPVELQVISHPCEWSFSQLKDAALLTLEIQHKAISSGMSLKDASAYNVQVFNGRPIFIDTLSFENLPSDQPWTAYRQFCQHFLAPLAIMAKTHIDLGQLLLTNIDGIPLELASRLLPTSTWLNFSLAIHIHLHARAQNKYANKETGPDRHKRKFSKNAFHGILDNLEKAILRLDWKPAGTEWHDYYSNNNYDEAGFSSKIKIVRNFLQLLYFRSVWDLGANTGVFSRLAAVHCEFVCAWDIDPACVELNYREATKSKSGNIYPLRLNLTNPTPGTGWDNNERASFRDRGPVDLILALGLIHHLVISNNVPLNMVARFLSGMTRSLIIEFVPKSDSQVKRLLKNRKDIFHLYDINNFEDIFSQYFKIMGKKPIDNTQRILYLMNNRSGNQHLKPLIGKEVPLP